MLYVKCVILFFVFVFVFEVTDVKSLMAAGLNGEFSL